LLITKIARPFSAILSPVTDSTSPYLNRNRVNTPASAADWHFLLNTQILPWKDLMVLGF
jgi:hypothetical protein